MQKNESERKDSLRFCSFLIHLQSEDAIGLLIPFFWTRMVIIFLLGTIVGLVRGEAFLLAYFETFFDGRVFY